MRAESACWQNDRDQTIAEAFPGYELAASRNDPWTFGPIAYWMWRAGKTDIPVDRLALPYALMIRGEWQMAAREWERIGCPFERALALAEGDEPAKRAALNIFEQLGAKPAANVLRKELYEKEHFLTDLQRSSISVNKKVTAPESKLLLAFH